MSSCRATNAKALDDEQMRALLLRWSTGPEQYQADADALIATARAAIARAEKADAERDAAKASNGQLRRCIDEREAAELRALADLDEARARVAELEQADRERLDMLDLATANAGDAWAAVEEWQKRCEATEASAERKAAQAYADAMIDAACLVEDWCGTSDAAIHDVIVELRAMADRERGSHADVAKGRAESDEIRRLRARDSWGEDDGAAVWWTVPIAEPPYVGTPLDDDFPDYATHWTPLVMPLEVERAEHTKEAT